MKQDNGSMAIVTIIGKDRVGILATAALNIAKMNGNIISVNQSVSSNLFTMMMEIDIRDMTCSCSELCDKIRYESSRYELGNFQFDAHNLVGGTDVFSKL